MKSAEKFRVTGDPTFIGKRGKKTAQRKGRYDGSWTPTEARTRERLMKQFTRLEGPSGNSPAYVASPLWCSHPGCHRSNGTHTHEAKT